MATQEIGRETDLARAWGFLAEQGITPDATGVYPEAAILDAIRARGWEVRVTGTEDDWYADVGEERGPDPSDDVYLLASGRDRQTALLRALDAALLWLDRDAVRDVLEQRARGTLGIGAEEFLRRMDAGQYEHAVWEPNQSELAWLVDLASVVR